MIDVSEVTTPIGHGPIVYRYKFNSHAHEYRIYYAMYQWCLTYNNSLKILFDIILKY